MANDFEKTTALGNLTAKTRFKMMPTLLNQKIHTRIKQISTRLFSMLKYARTITARYCRKRFSNMSLGTFTAARSRKCESRW